MLQIFVNPRYDFLGKRRWAYLVSALIVLAGLAHIGYRGGLQYGIDFAGGTLVQVRFQQGTTVDAVRSALDRVRLGDSVIQQFGDPQEYLIRLPAASGGLDEVSKRVEGGRREAGLPAFEVRRLGVGGRRHARGGGGKKGGADPPRRQINYPDTRRPSGLSSILSRSRRVRQDY